MIRLLVVSVLFLGGCVASRPLPIGIDLAAQASGTTASLRGLHAVDADVAWASGQNGTCLRTVDGGATWQDVGVAAAPETDFRDVHGFDAQTAVLLSAGAPGRVYRTEDGGSSWTLVYENDAEGVFFDAMAFWDERDGIAFSDPVGGRLLVIRTHDGGRSWTAIDPARLPPALEGEAGFAASGTCLAVAPPRRAWIGLGGATGADGARLLRTDDGGATWSVQVTPMQTDAASGIFSLDVAGPVAVAVGGVYDMPELAIRHAMRSDDGGVTWRAIRRGATRTYPARTTEASEVPPRGYRSAVAALPGSDSAVWLACGPTGVDLSVDGGRVWTAASDAGYHAVSVSDDGRGVWLSGAEGRIARLRWRYGEDGP